MTERPSSCSLSCSAFFRDEPFLRRGSSLEFTRIVGGGLAVGVLTGLAISQIIRHIDDPMIEITLTTARRVRVVSGRRASGFSGVIATVAAGMLCGNYAARTGMSPSTRIAAETFWEYVAFALNSIVFLLVGLHVNMRALTGAWLLILAAYAAVTLARAGVVFGVLALERWSRREPCPSSWGAVLTWGGMRGSLSMVLALALPSIAERDLLVTVTFGVVLLSILLQGLTIKPLLLRLAVVRRHDARQKYDIKRGELRMTHAALDEIAQLERLNSAPPAVLRELSEEYQARSRDATAAVESLRLEQEDLRAEEALRARRRVLMAEKIRCSKTFTTAPCRPRRAMRCWVRSMPALLDSTSHRGAPVAKANPDLRLRLPREHEFDGEHAWWPLAFLARAALDVRLGLGLVPTRQVIQGFVEELADSRVQILQAVQMHRQHVSPSVRGKAASTRPLS